MDDSLRLLPVVETLDLSRNKFTKVDNLLRCSKLKHLDLGFNQLRTISSFSKVTLIEILLLPIVYLYELIPKSPNTFQINDFGNIFLDTGHMSDCETSIEE